MSGAGPCNNNCFLLCQGICNTDDVDGNCDKIHDYVEATEWDKIWATEKDHLPYEESRLFSAEFMNQVKSAGDKMNSKLETINIHIGNFPNEKDEKYSGYREIPTATGHHVWNMPYFLTDLDTWIKKFKGILGAESC